VPGARDHDLVVVGPGDVAHMRFLAKTHRLDEAAVGQLDHLQHGFLAVLGRYRHREILTGGRERDFVQFRISRKVGRGKLLGHRWGRGEGKRACHA
jgi:hypothetical protein